MPENSDFKRARFIPQSGPDQGQAIDVHFNPASLQVTVSNTLEKQGSGTKSKQYVSQSSAKLTMDLIFDTTDDGQDVRTFTEKVARLMMPDENKVPPIVLFEWGTYKFQGMVEAYKETLDFFAPSGVPLRAAINLTLTKQDDVFAPTAKGERVNTAGSLAAADPAAVQLPPGADASSVSARAGDPRAARAIAQANGLESLRTGASASLTVGASVRLGPPAAFASGGAGIGGGISLGGGVSAGAGFSLGSGVGASAGIGGLASAGVSATQGAFAGLRAPVKAGSEIGISSARLLPRAGSPGLATDAGAAFQVGGRAVTETPSIQRADVGAKTSLRFEE